MIGYKNRWLEVISFQGLRNRKKLWLCRCKCGKAITRYTYQIRSENPKSCGCYIQVHSGNKNHHEYHTKHGMSGAHPLYRCWKNIKQRCYNPNNPDAKSYSVKGIVVCKEWKSDFNAFYAWAMRNGWHKGLVIDRINSTLGYSPDNCQFITMSENSRKVFQENIDLNKGINNRSCSIDEQMVRQIKNMLLHKIPQVRIVKELGVSRNIVWQIKNRKTWKHID